MGIIVFISYATADSNSFQINNIAEGLSEKPEIEDALYWEEDMDDDIYDYMEENVGRCDVFILFCSRNIKQSHPVKLEWKSALKLRKKIIPIFIDDEYIPNLLTTKLGIKFDETDIEKTIEKIYNLVLKKMRIAVQKRAEPEEQSELKDRALELKQGNALFGEGEALLRSEQYLDALDIFEEALIIAEDLNDSSLKSEINKLIEQTNVNIKTISYGLIQILQERISSSAKELSEELGISENLATQILDLFAFKDPQKDLYWITKEEHIRTLPSSLSPVPQLKRDLKKEKKEEKKHIIYKIETYNQLITRLEEQHEKGKIADKDYNELIKKRTAQLFDFKKRLEELEGEVSTMGPPENKSEPPKETPKFEPLKEVKNGLGSELNKLRTILKEESNEIEPESKDIKYDQNKVRNLITQINEKQGLLNSSPNNKKLESEIQIIKVELKSYYKSIGKPDEYYKHTSILNTEEKLTSQLNQKKEELRKLNDDFKRGLEKKGFKKAHNNLKKDIINLEQQLKSLKEEEPPIEAPKKPQLGGSLVSLRDGMLSEINRLKGIMRGAPVNEETEKASIEAPPAPQLPPAQKVSQTWDSLREEKAQLEAKIRSILNLKDFVTQKHNSGKIDDKSFNKQVIKLNEDYEKAKKRLDEINRRFD